MKLAAFCLALALSITPWATSIADERTLTPEQMEALANEGELATPTRPANLTDLTKGEFYETEDKPWNLGPTGIVGTMVGRFAGDQIRVDGVLEGSPAEGKIQRGDVILGVEGQPFEPGGHMGYLLGKAIIAAEEEAKGGRLTLQIWRDRNYADRYASVDVIGADIDDIFEKAQEDDGLYEWKPDEVKQGPNINARLEEFPLDPVLMDIDLTLRVLPSYSDTSPFNCPKTDQILEDAWAVLEERFVVDPQKPRSGRGGILEAMALVASGKPEHRELVAEWVRSARGRVWHPPTEPIGAMFEPGYRGYKGYQSWHKGFNGLQCALYYDATGDEFVLPALEKYAIETAMGQSGGGSWGHTFAYPSFNGGEFHRMNPGYGALNCAGNRCFFLITLARELGIQHPEIDDAIERAHHFFGSYVDQGAIPYGDHGAASTDDSNGKNTGIAFSMKLLGDDYGAKYFAQMSTHCSFTRRGGHGHDYHGNWSSWAATMCGPEGRALAERNLRWRRTLCRRHDGAFAYNSPTGPYGALRDPTATAVMHYAVGLEQTLITGKDLDESMFLTEREMEHLLTSAIPQLNDEVVLERAGLPFQERTTDEVFDLLDIFKPKVRGIIANELGGRFQAGESEIAPRLVGLLTSEIPRMRDGACRGLGACGEDVVLAELSKLTALLDDPHDFVRVTAAKVIGKVAADVEEVQLALLEATVDEQQVAAPNSLRNSTQTSLFAGETPLAMAPFEAGFDDDLLRDAMEKLIQLDPVGGRGFLSSRRGAWKEDTVVQLACLITFAAEEEQIGDQMFANRSEPAQALLAHFNFEEAAEAAVHRLRKKAAIPRHIRPFVDFKRGPILSAVEAAPGNYHDVLPVFYSWILDNPTASTTKVVGDKKIPVYAQEIIAMIEGADETPSGPSIMPAVQEMFQGKLDALDGTAAKLELCRQELMDVDRKTYFRQIAAMDFLVETLGPDALGDLIPYLGHSYWRLREHSQKLARELVTIGAADQLLEAFPAVADFNPPSAVGMLEIFADGDLEDGLELARAAMANDDPSVRGAAAYASAVLGHSGSISEIIAHLQSAETPEDLRGCERGLLVYREEPAYRDAAVKELIVLLPAEEPTVRESAYWLLGQLGGAEALAALDKAAETEDDDEFSEVIWALSYSTSPEADELMLKIAANDTDRAMMVANQSARRIVPRGDPSITDDDRLDFAEPMLKLALDPSLISYLGRVYHSRSLRALMYCLENGVSAAAGSLVTCAEGMAGTELSAEDGKIAAEALRGVMEYIEVTQLRGGVDGKDFRQYPGWKALQARAGRVLLEVHKPEAAPIPGLDGIDLDL